jgi:hypothetical protein
MPVVRPDVRLGLAVFVVAVAATDAKIAAATSGDDGVDSGIATGRSEKPCNLGHLTLPAAATSTALIGVR